MIRSLRNIDWSLFILMLFILIYGVIIVYTASTTKVGDEIYTSNYFIRQIAWILISLAIFILVIKLPYSIIDSLIYPIYIVSILMLIAVLFTPGVKGSHRWISFGLFNFQPSELAKLATVLVLAKILSKRHINDWHILSRTFIITILPFSLILIQPDLGTAVAVAASAFVILLASDLPKFYLVLLLTPLLSIVTSISLFLFILMILLTIFVLYKMRISYIIMGFTVVINTFIFTISPLVWNSLKAYQQNRILSFIDPLRDPLGAGYQIIQSRIAIGSGGTFGKGFLMGTQKNLEFLPEHHTDFIFSVVGEEFGFIGSSLLIILFFLLLYRIMRVMHKLKQPQTYLIVVGIASFLTFQIFVNIGMNMGIVPTTGIPLPLISYGGSNLLINIVAIALIQKFIKERSVFE